MGCWEADVRLPLPSGEFYRERVRVPVSGKTSAKRWADAREAEVLVLAAKGLDAAAIRLKLSGKEASEGSAVPILNVFRERFVTEHLVAECKKPSSVAAVESIYRHHLASDFGSKALDSITESDVQALKAKLVGKSPKTVNNVLTVLSSMLRRAVEWGVIERAPRVKLLRAPQEQVEFYDFVEFDRLLQAARLLDPRIELLVLLGGHAGLRRGEILALEWSDVDLQRQRLHIRRSEWNGNVTVPKGGRDRRVAMTDALSAALKAHRHLRGPRVLYADGGITPTNKIVRRWMERAQARAGLTVMGGVHVLRHTFCSHLAMRGATPTAIQALAGHTTLSVTSRYMHLSPAAKDDAIRLLNRTAEVVEAGMEAHPAPVKKPSAVR
jgi:integrase